MHLCHSLIVRKHQSLDILVDVPSLVMLVDQPSRAMLVDEGVAYDCLGCFLNFRTIQQRRLYQRTTPIQRNSVFIEIKTAI